MVSGAKYEKKSNEPILGNIQKRRFCPTAPPTHDHFFLFSGKMAFLQKNYNIVLNVLRYSIFMQQQKTVKRFKRYSNLKN